MRRSRVLLLSMMASLGCSSTSSAEGPRTKPGASGTAPVASASATPQAHDPPTDPEPVAAIGPFTVALSSVSTPRFFQLEDALVAVDNRFYRPAVYRLGEGGFVEMPAFFEGLRVRKGTEDLLDFQVESLGGNTGGDVLASVSMPGERGGTVATAKRRGGEWSADPEKTVYELSGGSGGFWYFGPRATWGAHAIAAPTADEPTFRAFECTTGFLEGARAGVVPVSTTAGAQAGCTRRMQTYDALFNGAGDRLIALGSACGSGAAAVEWWTDGKADGAFMELPQGGALDAGSLSVETLDAAPWIFGARGGRLFAAHLDGTTWKDATPGPAAGPIEVRLIGKPGALAVFGRDAAYRRTDRAWTAIPLPEGGRGADDFFEDGPDTALWASFQGRLYRMAPTGTRFERVALPEVKGATFGVTGVSFDAAREPVVLARSSDGAILTFLLATRSRATVVVAPSATASRPFGSVMAPNASCTKPFVVLYGMAKATPDDYDFPLTRKAVKGKLRFAGVRFFVARDGGSRFFIARAPTVQIGADLVNEISASLKDSKPQLLCGEPAEIIRELKFDRATGDVVP